VAVNRIGFRPFFNKITDGEELNIIIDSNALIASGDELHPNHEEITSFIDSLDQKVNLTLFTTVTTKAEYLDYQRRRFLTEGLLSLSSQPQISLATNVKAKLSTIKGRKNIREKNELKRSLDESDDIDSNYFYFRDSEIKEIKKVFRARDVQNEAGWLKICDMFLSRKLIAEEALIDELCVYLSPYKEDQANLFNNKVDWNNATQISAKSGMGFSDSMILNMVLATNIDYILTLDYDLVYASAVSAPNKTIIIPDKRIKQFKQTLKRI